MDISASRHVGEFILSQRIGGRGSAVVYRAYQPTINRYVALKLIDLPENVRVEDPAYFERRFIQEAQVLASLEHPHIVPIYHYGIVPGESAYIAMRLMGGTLDEVLREGILPQERAVDIMLQVIAGLSYAHKKGVVHRDIKPANILFDEAGSACLTDFGLTRMMEQSVKFSSPEVEADAAVYLAPELIRGTSSDPRTDIYSLGVILYRMLTGRLPIESEQVNIATLLRLIESQEPLPPRQANPEITPELERIILQALRKEPRERFFDVQEMADALEAHLHTAQRPRVFPTIAAMPLRLRQATYKYRRRLVFVGLFLILLILLLAGISTLVQQNGPLQPPTILAGVRSPVASTAPSSAEISQARRQLGSTGFIAYIACTLDSQFEAARAREMGDEAQTYGLAFRVYDSENDAYKALTLIERARLEGASAIILCPLKPDVLSDSLTSLASAKMPLVLTEALPSSYGGVMLDGDDHEIGRLAGTFIAEALVAQKNTPVNVVILDAPDYAFSDARVQGFLDGLSGALPSARQVARFPTGVDQAASNQAITELIQQGQSIDALFSVTDVGAYGAVDALSAQGNAPDSVVIASVNAESLALNDIFNGKYIEASIDVARDVGSKGAVDAAVKLLGGGTLPEILTLPTGVVITHDIVTEPTPVPKP